MEWGAPGEEAEGGRCGSRGQAATTAGPQIQRRRLGQRRFLVLRARGEHLWTVGSAVHFSPAWKSVLDFSFTCRAAILTHLPPTAFGAVLAQPQTPPKPGETPP